MNSLTLVPSRGTKTQATDLCSGLYFLFSETQSCTGALASLQAWPGIEEGKPRHLVPLQSACLQVPQDYKAQQDTNDRVSEWAPLSSMQPSPVCMCVCVGVVFRRNPL